MTTDQAATWPQPREGITGRDLTSTDLLSLDDAAIDRRRIMLALLRALQAATLVGHPAPIVAAMQDRMNSPQPGDLVAEHTALMTSESERGNDQALKGLGILITRRTEWWDTDEDWAAYVAGEQAARDEWNAAHPGDPDTTPVVDERMTDTAWYVQYGPDPGDVCRWVNCTFVAVPADWRQLRQLGWES